MVGMIPTPYFLKAVTAIAKAKQRERCEGNLIDFVEYMWPVVEPAIPFIKGWAISAIAEHLQAVSEGYITRLLMNVPPGFTKSLLTDVFWPAWEWGPLNMPWLRYVCASYSNHLTERDNMRCRNIVTSDRYQSLWGNRFKISNEQFTKIKFANNKTGWKLATSVGGIGVGERGDRFIIDDPNNTMEMESEQVRETTNMWFTEVVPDRLNNPEKSAIVIIQQRLHEDDVSGIALSRDMGYTHLMIPVRHDTRRHCVTVIGIDPKTDEERIWEDPRTEEDELAWPERFTEKVVNDLERDKGPYAFCSTAEAPILMADLSMKRIDQIVEGDSIVGFKTGNNERRARLKPAEVLSISRSIRPVVKITLSSGAVVRCTKDHKWWTGRNDQTHPPYSNAKVGSVLSRVCPSSLPILTPDDARLAGWLAGFFDGEGSVSLSRRREGEENALISFSQGDGRNGPICDKLEMALDHFGFEWGRHIRARKTEHSVRNYWLKMASEGRASRLPLYQRFLHIVQPVKWRDRLIDATVSGRLYTGSEKVISIEPDGVETVYGLETTTGNYVAWGLASSNSGQYMQSPSPRGGSIIKDEYWQLWESDTFPNFEFMLASADTAFTEKQENDPSAMTVWGLWRDESGNPKIMLVYAWTERLQFNALYDKIFDTCVKQAVWRSPNFPVDKILIENKGSGISVGHELHRLLRGSGSFGVELVDPKKYGDKVARVQSIQHLFADGMVYAPDRPWAAKVIQQCSVFPKGSHDDLVDTTSQALRYLRDQGFALKKSEQSLVDAEELAYTPRSATAPLYQV